MGYEYIFFDASLADALVSFAANLGVPAQMRSDPLGGWVVQVPEDLPGVAEDAIEVEYDRLMLCQRDVLDAADGAESNDILVVELALPGGQSCWVRVPAVLGRRLADHFSFEEIHQLVALVAAQALQPSDAPLCQKIDIKTAVGPY